MIHRAHFVFSHARRAACALGALCLAGGAFAAERADIAGALATLDSPGNARTSQTPTGDLTYLGAPAGAGFAPGASGSATDAARGFLLDHGSSFGVRSSKVDFQPERENKDHGRTYVRLQQTYNGIPVFAAKALVQVGTRNRIESAAVDICRHVGALDGGRPGTTPTLSASDAVAAALKAAQKASEVNDLAPIDSPQLVIYAPEVVDNSGAPVLAWALKVGSLHPGVYLEQYLVNAHTGEVALHFNLIETAKNRQIYDSNNTSADPGTLVRSEGGPAVSLADANLAYQYYGDTYDFYLSHHGRDSVDNAGLTLSATVRYCDPNDTCPFQNAFWDGSRMYFGDGFAAADDVVAHELTHGVTQYTSNLIYLNQSGAINESFSDVWGEFVDQTNTGGTDTAPVKWLMGEDVPGIGAIRSMKDPTAFLNPDSTCSAFWWDSPADSGGVHTNSGVNNKLCYLLTDGDTFNGHTVTGMGINTVASLYYEVQTNLLTDASNYLDLYHALLQAAINLGLNAGQQANIEEACQAVAITESTNCHVPPPPPANDDCANAIAVSLNTVYTGDVTSATGTETLTCSSTDLLDSNDAWFTFAPPSTGAYTVTLCTSGSGSTDTTLGVFTGDCNTHTLLACNDDGCDPTTFGVPSHLTRTLNQGTTYLIRVATYGAAGGPFALQVLAGSQAAGDPISCNDHATGTLNASSPRYNRIFGDNSAGLNCDALSADSSNDACPYVSLPFHADAPANFSAVVRGRGTTLEDTVMSIYCNFDPLHPDQNLIVYNNDFHGPLSGFKQEDGIALVPGNTYYLVLSTFTGDAGGLIDTGTYDVCIGPHFAFGEATCDLASCPDFNGQGNNLYTYIGSVLSSTQTFSTDDLDATGMRDHYEAALAGHVLCNGRVAWYENAICTFQANRATLAGEASYASLQPFADALAMLLSISPSLRQTLITDLSLTGSYSVVTDGAKSGAEVLSPGGDPDHDGLTNQQEYQNVLANGGTQDDYVAAALNPLLDGNPATQAALPVAGYAGVVLAALLLPLGLFDARRKRA